MALTLAGGLLYALMMLVIRPDLAQHGHREVRSDGCITATWRDPITGRDETVPGWPRC